MLNDIIKRNGITFGIVIGLISALTTALIYTFNINLFVSPVLGLFGFATYLIISIILLSKTKKALNGEYTFKEAFTTYFIFSIIGVLISSIFNIFLFNVIDPSASETVKELTIKSVVQTMQKYGTPASSINEMISKMKENNPYSVIEILKGSVFLIVLYSILGLIMAAFFKSKSKE